MKKLSLISLLAFFIVSCGVGTTDYGCSFTHVNKMMASFGADGKAVIFSADGEGQIENMYFAGDYENWHHPGNTVLNIWCDDILCVSGKLYELACLNMDYVEEKEYENIFLETPLFSKFGAHNSISLDFKIPYYKSCKVELVQANPNVKDYLWTTVRANTKVNVVFDGKQLPKGVYFKGIRAENQHVKSGDQFTMMETQKNSMIIGTNLFLNSETESSMEACLRAINTATGKAEYLSSGLEDYFLGTYYFDSGIFRGYKCGLTWLDRTDKKVKLSAYRQFPDNPLCFNYPVRLTVRNGEQNEINSESEITDNIYLQRGDATIGAIVYYYEW